MYSQGGLGAYLDGAKEGDREINRTGSHHEDTLRGRELEQLIRASYTSHHPARYSL